MEMAMEQAVHAITHLVHGMTPPLITKHSWMPSFPTPSALPATAHGCMVMVRMMVLLCMVVQMVPMQFHIHDGKHQHQQLCITIAKAAFYLSFVSPFSSKKNKKERLHFIHPSIHLSCLSSISFPSPIYLFLFCFLCSLLHPLPLLRAVALRSIRAIHPMSKLSWLTRRHCLHHRLQQRCRHSCMRRNRRRC
jgi:hypothetical protein